MYTYRDEKYNKSRKTQKNMPSFSSTLLDEIYRSIDGGAEKSEEKVVKKQSGYRTTNTNITEVEEEKASIRRACLVEKWIEKEKYEKVLGRSLQDNNDLLFFSSTSSSNSDSSGALSSSDTEFFASQTKPKVSCFSARPKPIRTARGNTTNHEKSRNEDDSSKYKSRALKMYADLKNIKQPISPGGRLTSFINSLFSNANGKKSKNIDTSRKNQDLKPPKAQSASSFSRSCLSKYSPRSRERMRNGDQRTVRFHPVSVVVDEESRPCGHKCVYHDRSGKYGKPPLPINALSKMEKKNREVGENAQYDLKGYNGNIRRRDIGFSMFRKINGGDDDDGEDDDYDGVSDSSSDLFELDHIAFGNNGFREELPVYETTRLDASRVIGSRSIR